MGGNVTWMHAGCCETTCQIRCNRWQQSRTSWPLTSKQNRYENMTCNLWHRKPRNDQQMTNQMTKTWQTNDKHMTNKWPKNDPKMPKKCQHKFKTTNRIQKKWQKMTKKWQNIYFGFSNVCRPMIFLMLAGTQQRVAMPGKEKGWKRESAEVWMWWVRPCSLYCCGQAMALRERLDTRETSVSRLLWASAHGAGTQIPSLFTLVMCRKITAGLSYVCNIVGSIGSGPW